MAGLSSSRPRHAGNLAASFLVQALRGLVPRPQASCHIEVSRECVSTDKICGVSVDYN